MSKFKVIGQMKRTPTNRDIGKSVVVYCKRCNRPMSGTGRYHELCDRCHREQMRQDISESEVAK